MRFVYVLEDDPKLRLDIVEAIQAVDPKIQIRIFTKLDQFVEWVKLVMQQGVVAIPNGGSFPENALMEPVSNEEHKLVAVISKIEFLGVKQLNLLKKTRALFIKQKICTAEDPTAFVLTAFEEPTFKITELEDRILNNVIMKPFDKLILTQHLTFAIDGRHPPSKYTISNQKTSAIIEMLKDVNMEAFSEVGFVTRSERSLDGNLKISKYYGKSFSTDSKSSLMATYLEGKPDPSRPGQYLCSFAYFGLSSSQISAIRGRIRANQCEYPYLWADLYRDEGPKTRPVGIVILDESEQNSLELMDHLKRKFSNVVIASYKNYAEMLYDLDPKLADAEASEKKAVGIPSGSELLFVFDQTGTRIVQIIKGSTEPIELFGKTETEILQNQSWWQNHMNREQLKKWKEWLQKPTNTGFIIEVDAQKFYLKPGAIDKDAKTKKIKVGFKEMNLEEKYQFITQNSRLPKAVDIVLASHRFVQYTESEKWNRVKNLFKNRGISEDQILKTHLMILSSRDYLDQEIRELSQFVSDIYYRPLDRSYLAQKLKFFVPALHPTKDTVDYPCLSRAELIQTAMPVQISEISEAGLIMQYHRNLAPGEFRNFVLWTAYEANAPRAVATCNFTESSAKEKELHDNHFVFFGVTDHFLKAVRIWIRDNYISGKEKGG